MNLRKESGITIVALIITIIIMLILAGVGVYYATDAMDKARLEDIKTDMISIKTKAKIITEQYNFKDIDSLVGTEITEEEARILGISKNEQTRKMSSNDLTSQGLSSSIDGDKYVIYYNIEDPNNCEVYYLEGYNGKHSLTDLQALQEKK